MVLAFLEVDDEEGGGAAAAEEEEVALVRERVIIGVGVVVGVVDLAVVEEGVMAAD